MQMGDEVLMLSVEWVNVLCDVVEVRLHENLVMVDFLLLEFRNVWWPLMVLTW